jgi:thiol-disulfide isomerase/thioredoxin
MSKCPKCKTDMITVKRFIQEWDADEEPYEAGKKEDHDGINEDVMIGAEYCENCQAFKNIDFDANMIQEK